MGWIEFSAAFAAFFLSHSVPLRPPLRPWLQARLGRGGFTLGYCALSLCVLGWVIGAAGRAPHLPLWSWAPWQAHVPQAVMGLVCLILGLSLGRPNPFSFGGLRNERFDPMRPGLLRWMRHPLLLALGLWAGAHVVPNGDLAHVLLFGSFAGFALLGMRLIDRRKRREMGAQADRLTAAVRDAPFRAWPVSGETLLRILGSGALYAALLWLHPLLFGVNPWP